MQRLSGAICVLQCLPRQNQRARELSNSRGRRSWEGRRAVSHARPIRPSKSRVCQQLPEKNYLCLRSFLLISASKIFFSKCDWSRRGARSDGALTVGRSTQNRMRSGRFTDAPASPYSPSLNPTCSTFWRDFPARQIRPSPFRKSEVPSSSFSIPTTVTFFCHRSAGTRTR